MPRSCKHSTALVNPRIRTIQACRHSASNGPRRSLATRNPTHTMTRTEEAAAAAIVAAMVAWAWAAMVAWAQGLCLCTCLAGPGVECALRRRLPCIACRQRTCPRRCGRHRSNTTRALDQERNSLRSRYSAVRHPNRPGDACPKDGRPSRRWRRSPEARSPSRQEAADSCLGSPPQASPCSWRRGWHIAICLGQLSFCSVRRCQARTMSKET